MILLNSRFSFGPRTCFTFIVILMLYACGDAGPGEPVSAARAGYSVSVSIIDSNGRPVKALGFRQQVEVVATIKQGSRPVANQEVDIFSDIGEIIPYSGIVTTDELGRAIFGFEAGSEPESGSIEISFGSDMGEVLETTAIKVARKSR